MKLTPSPLYSLVVLLGKPCCSALESLAVRGTWSDLLMLSASALHGRPTLCDLSLRALPATPVDPSGVSDLLWPMDLPQLTNLSLSFEATNFDEDVIIPPYDFRFMRRFGHLHSLHINIYGMEEYSVLLPELPRLQELALHQDIIIDDLAMIPTTLTSLAVGQVFVPEALSTRLPNLCSFACRDDNGDWFTATRDSQGWDADVCGLDDGLLLSYLWALGGATSLTFTGSWGTHRSLDALEAENLPGTLRHLTLFMCSDENHAEYEKQVTHGGPRLLQALLRWPGLTVRVLPA